ncbi:MAG: CapA family protein [Spirochaetaceae bacterium]|jgi:poly-gamma-glutamate synthesis protein (capsule biosynthesis protein)|nr:CapA family protein [Spirochaetaceae bacterium]
MIYMAFRTVLRNLFRFCCFIATLLRPGHYRISHVQEGDSDVRFGPRDICWWLYKYYYRQVELPEPGQGIAEYFAAQKPDFSLPAGFIPGEAARVAAGGDILVSCHIRGDNTAHLWDDVEDYFFNADITCANLESPIAPSQPFTALPKNLLIPLRLNNSPAVFDACWRNGRGINFFSTANNHALDRDESGLLETLDFLDSRGAPHTGTARSKAEQEDIPVLERNGIRIAFISWTFSLNGKKIPPGKEYLVNHLRLNMPGCDIWPIKDQIRVAKEKKNADIVIACLHWGLEFESYPIQHFIDLGHELLEAGIDVIIGNHAHGLQPVEQYPFTDPYSGLEKQGLICYALGDLLSWHPAKNTRLGCLPKICLQKGSLNGRTVTLISGLELKPIYLYSAIRLEHCSDFRILDLEHLARRIVAEDMPDLPLGKTQKREVLRLRALSKKILHGARQEASAY